MAKLPSWRPGPARDAIAAFLDSAQAVPAVRRTAVFDHDGTLRCERPTLMLFDFLVHEIQAAVDRRPETAERADFQLLLRGNLDEIAAFGMRRCLMSAYELAAGLTPEEFAGHVRRFIDGSTDHGYPDYRQLVYQPMLELMEALRAAGFTIFINARYSAEVVRAFSYEYYGIPPHCVIGTPVDYDFVRRDGTPALVRSPAVIGEISLGATNVVNIQTHTGTRPILAAGNSIGDREMLEYAVAGEEPSLALLVDHDDADREYAYEQQLQTLSGAEPFADAGRREGWIVVSMRDDWSTIFTAQQNPRLG